jgi:hypothetical protein
MIVLGGLGLFGRTAVEHLCRAGIAAKTASRSAAADLQIDANDMGSIREVIQPGDVVIDAAGPFRARSATLVEAAIETGFDVVDINDDLVYAEKVLALESRIATAGIRVVSSASSVSAVAAAIVQQSGVAAPVRVTAFLAPATSHTANVGTALSLAGSVGEPIRVFRDGRLQSLRGWSEARRFPMPPPVGPVRGRLFESADALYLPRIWPTLRDVAIYVDTNTWGGNTMLDLAARSYTIRRMLTWQVRLGTWLARKFGSSAGGIGYEIEDADGRIMRWVIMSAENSYVVAVAPAVLAARAVFENRFAYSGLVPADRHVAPAELWKFFHENGITMKELIGC